jgi:hypothetical protein
LQLEPASLLGRPKDAGDHIIGASASTEGWTRIRSEPALRRSRYLWEFG